MKSKINRKVLIFGSVFLIVLVVLLVIFLGGNKEKNTDHKQQIQLDEIESEEALDLEEEGNTDVNNSEKDKSDNLSEGEEGKEQTFPFVDSEDDSNEDKEELGNTDDGESLTDEETGNMDEEPSDDISKTYGEFF